MIGCIQRNGYKHVSEFFNGDFVAIASISLYTVPLFWHIVLICKLNRFEQQKIQWKLPISLQPKPKKNL